MSTRSSNSSFGEPTLYERSSTQDDAGTDVHTLRTLGRFRKCFGGRRLPGPFLQAQHLCCQRMLC